MIEISILDTSLSSDNIGDDIIMDSVNNLIRDMFPCSYIWRIASHERLSKRSREFLSRSSMCFIGGTNLLSSYISYDALWPIDESDAKIFNELDTICIGTGWSDYMENPNEVAASILNLALSKNITHSVRDSYTEKKISHIGLASINTSCPTTWMLDKNHCRKIPSNKSDSVVITLTAWRRNFDKDKEILELIKNNYKDAYFFPQMCDDYYYFNSMGINDIKVINPSLQEFDLILENEDVDFIGTRLHGGIRALQKKRRTLILSVDNRSEEIRKDINIQVLNRNEDVSKILEWIYGGDKTNIILPYDNIISWKSQFTN
ncbi:polysaccharide pyruvyl transferase family protein [Kozakia baliensis]|uniref:polysaccharide pyruvyl transferase family protein n=1 Tax=Kozakia baliensis TaxID=153496 RepID=UPI000496D5A5|nr:polysaccharide pyruvyl transferase family protein [Kozakia baliensis]